MAKAKRLERFKELEYIDTIVRRTGGAYTHEDVFNMEAGFAFNLLIMYYEQTAFSLRAEQIRKELNQNKTK